MQDRDLDLEYYLRCNPDLAAAGTDPHEHYRLYGRAEGRWPFARFQRPEASPEVVPRAPMSHDRNLMLGRHVDLQSTILEIGPSYNPVAPKAKGFKTVSVDHATRMELVQKYRGDEGVDVSRIEDVDYVWKTGTLLDAVPEELHASFDVVIASNVLEHIPDPIRFLAGLSKLIRDDGIIVLALPDKRLCFDLFRPLTHSSAWVDAFHNKASKHSLRIVLEFLSTVVRRPESIVWKLGNDLGSLAFANVGLTEAYKRAVASLEPNAAYVDCHAWTFTPASAALIFNEVYALGLSGLLPAEITTPVGYEFFVDLCKSDCPPISDDQRLSLMRKAALELGQVYTSLCQ